MHFIESERKTISVEKFGIIFSKEPVDGGAHEVMPLDVAEKMKQTHSLDHNDNMPKAFYDELSNYITSSAKQLEIEEKKKEFKAKWFSDKYLDNVLHYADFEYELEQDKTDSSYSLTYTSRKSIKQDGDKSHKYIYEFICPDFDTEMYPQNSEVDVILASDDPNRPKRLKGSIFQIEDASDNQKRLIITFRNQFNEKDLPEYGQIKRKANECQKNVRYKVVEQFKTGEVKSKYMLTAFNNHKKIVTQDFEKLKNIDAIMKEIEDRAPKGQKPFEKQKDAIKAGILSKDLALVLGPPGTGKTTVIVEWALYFMRQGKRVLISSKNNKAVDNAFERIAEKQLEMPELKDHIIARLGNVDKVQDNVKDYLIDNQHEAIQQKILSSASSCALQLKKDLESIAAAEGDLKKMSQNLERFFKIKNELETNYYKKINQCIQKILSEHNNIKEEQAKVESQIESLNAIKEKIAEARIYLEEEKKRFILIRLFHKRETNYIQKNHDALVREFNAAKITDGSIPHIKKYNDAVLNIKKLLNDQTFKNLKNEYRNLEKVLSGNKKISVNPAFYPAVSYTFSDDKEKFNAFLNQLKSLKKKMLYLKEILGEWHSIVTDKTNTVLSDILIDSVSVVGATCIGINTNRQFTNVDFDVAIIDEAGQIQIHDAIVPMSRATKTLMLGDHKQIPPQVDDAMIKKCREKNVDTTLLEQSFFQYIFEKGNIDESHKISLDTQFRMPKPVADILSYQFYDNKYFSYKDKHTDDRSDECKKVFSKQLVLIDTSDSDERFEKEVKNKDSKNIERYNPYEAKLVATVLKKFGAGSENPLFGIDKIGVIAPLKKQKETIQKTVKQNIKSLSDANIKSMIATLDSFQGQERKLIIYSSTRSNKINSIGFLNELRRLNVALSRCKEQLVFIGDFSFLTTCVDKERKDNDSFKNNNNLNNKNGFFFSGETFENEEEYEYEENQYDQYSDSYDDDEFEIDESEFDEVYDDEFDQNTEDEYSDEDKDGYVSPELDKTVRRFSEFMQYFVDEVKKGNGLYIKSKDLGE
ncbi:MAG: hypothetical protein E7404_05550 [Ruminococcaceae bacterium]|nr:hypothetical protein [Oscillospiraceae bacterium]